MPQPSETTLRQQLADCHRMMVMAELLDYSGHVSARIPGTDRVLIGPGYVTRDILTADEVITVDLNSKKIEGRTREAASRWVEAEERFRALEQQVPAITYLDSVDPPRTTLARMLKSQKPRAPANTTFEYVSAAASALPSPPIAR